MLNHYYVRTPNAVIRLTTDANTTEEALAEIAVPNPHYEAHIHTFEVEHEEMSLGVIRTIEHHKCDDTCLKDISFNS